MQQGSPGARRGCWSQVMSKAEQPEFDLSTSAGGRGYVAHLFTATLKRYDFASYIKEHLAADFACTLAAHLAQAEAAALAREAELREELAKVKERAAFWYETSGKAIDAMTMVTVQRDSLQLRLNASSGLINPFDLEYSQELCDSMLANISALVARSATVADEQERRLEALAKNIYGTCFSDFPGFVPWVDGGNSVMQGKARDQARKQLDAASGEQVNP